MKKIIQLAFVLLVLISASSLAKAQNAISDEKRKLIAEIIVATKADQGVKEMMEAAFQQMSENYAVLVQTMLEKRTDLTTAQKKEVADILIAQNAREKNFRDRLMKAIDFREYVERSSNALYDKFFTESELRDMLAFYKTPTGQKLNDVMPKLTVEAVKLAQEILLPKILDAVDQQIAADIESQQKSVRKPN